jgi:hypothetical protein
LYVDHVDQYAQSLDVAVALVIDTDIPMACSSRSEPGPEDYMIVAIVKMKSRRYMINVTWDHKWQGEAGEESVSIPHAVVLCV